jgi:D-sedoheptulose 7-phosphate isomerase
MREKKSSFEGTVRDRIGRSITVKQELLQTAVPIIGEVSGRIIEAYKKDHTVYWFGNGGSAADAQHLACELVNRFYLERRGLPSQAFTVNTSILTAVSNDYDFESSFAKQVEAFAREGDVLIGISTSGNAKNVVNALKLGKNMGTLNVGLTGRTGGAMSANVDYLITVPSDDTPFIQECHILVGHIICYIVEQELFTPEVPR